MVNELPLYPLDRAPGPPGSVDFERTECFYACLNAIKGCLDNFFSVTDEEILGYPMPVHLHFSRCTHILYRLLLMDDPAWNRSAISSTIDLFDTLERCAERYFAVPAKMGLDTDGTDIYTRAAEVLRNTVPLWQRALEDVGAIPGAAVAATEEQSADPVVGQGLATMDISVDGWFSDVFSICDTY